MNAELCRRVCTFMHICLHMPLLAHGNPPTGKGAESTSASRAPQSSRNPGGPQNNLAMLSLFMGGEAVRPCMDLRGNRRIFTSNWGPMKGWMFLMLFSAESLFEWSSWQILVNVLQGGTLFYCKLYPSSFFAEQETIRSAFRSG